MNGVVGDILPVALGVAISPVPIIAAILMLLSPKARVTSVGFLLGWVLGIVLASTIFTLLASVLPDSGEDESAPVKGVIQLALGALLLLLAVRNWRNRPKPGEEPEMPKWMGAIDSMSFFGAAGLGILLSGVNPKNLLLSASAGVTIGSAALGTGATIGAIAIFTVIAASTVLVPVLAYLLAADRLRGPLDALREWLAKQNALIMAVLLLVLGVVVIGKGIGSF
ncbi:GAP family protein [Microbacterium aoyamense]|uniref:GAP family protein n=1 Tax=Microbacterium aoyamense TaxID=344166 RepID=A0ABN2PXJ9_9MICO|nr:GAP family protein [Microbacterium aoyamense]